MRKIKPKKKDTDKKRKKVDALLKDLFHYHGDLHDEVKTLETVKKIADLQPDDPVPAEKVASIYIDYNRRDEADKAVTYLEEHFPPSAYRLFLRGRVCDLKQDYGGCIKYSEMGLEHPDIDLLTRMMIHNILGHAYRYAGDAPNSLKHYELSAKMDISGAADPQARYYVEKIKREDYSNFLFSLHNVNVSREKLFEEICGFNDLYNHVQQMVHDPATHPRHEKLRIGYISPDIRRHVVAFFSYAFYKCYDKSRFEVYIYAKNKEDHVTAEFKKGVDHYRNILHDEPAVAAQKIKDDEIDILVDLSGHTANNVMGVVCHKPAPIIISAIGWFNTTGVKAIDYFMVDKYTDPVGLNEKFFSEKMLRLQHSHFCYMWHDEPTVVNPAPCTKNGFVTFVSFNNFTKVTDETLRVWAKIVNAVPGAKLYLKGKAFRDKYGTDHAIARIEAAGLSREKLIYEPDEQRYLIKYARADIALDTFPYPGGGTTCDALYMGLPVITLVEERHNSRFGYSLLTNCGLGELCAFSEEEYIQKAVDLANDWDRIRDYHLTIRRKMEVSPVMNDAIYMGEVEECYEKIFNAWINGEELPEFPQEPEPITPEQAEDYYYKAMSYFELEPDFHKDKIKDIVHVKRTLYNLEKAAQADKEHQAEIYYLIAACKRQLKNYVGAYEAIRKVPDGEYSRDFLCDYHELRGKIAFLNSKMPESAENFERAAQMAMDRDLKAELYSGLFSALELLDIPADKIAAANFNYQNLFKDVKPFTEYHERAEGDKIKIGYVSSNFRAGKNFSIVFGMIAAHNREKFEVTCYSLTDVEDAYTGLFKKFAEHYEVVEDMTFEEIAQKIHDDKIDVLIDPVGHGEGNGLPVFAYKPAPIQITGIGYPSTTGLDAMDYFITDEVIDPPDDEDNAKLFKEKFLYMPSNFCYAQREDVPTPEYAPCTKRDYPVFGTICSYKEMNDDILRIWHRISQLVPNAVFLMRAPEFESISSMDQLYGRMKEIGFDMDKVLFRPSTANYMAEMTHIDVILDVYPQSASSMMLDALYMGVPVVSFYAKRRSSRIGKSIVTAVGLPDLSSEDVGGYINRAVALVKEVTTLDVLHKNLRGMLKKSQPLNPKVYMTILEKKLEDLVNNFEPPEKPEEAPVEENSVKEDFVYEEFINEDSETK